MRCSSTAAGTALSTDLEKAKEIVVAMSLGVAGYG
jgi:hypothetical protein